CAYVKQYLDQHFSENINLDELAEMSYINKYYLVHTFKKYSGMTPINYLNYKRLKEACMLLKTTNHSIAQIANIIGMSSQSYFAQSFKKQFNMSPNEYRKQSSEKK
ncbi:MAG: AraC family transcriptional regulator, partial [Anaerorhabdus sp.]